MASSYEKYAVLEPLLSGSTATYESGSIVLYASASSPGADASLFFFKGDGTSVDMAGGGTLTVDGDSGSGTVTLSSQELTIAGGTGVDTSMSGQTLTITADMSEATEAAVTIGTDYALFLDGGVNGSLAKDSWSDIATAMAGTVTTTGLAASSGVFKWDLQNWTASTTIADADLIGVDDGANGTIRKMTRANFLGSAAAAFSSGLTSTTISGSSTLKSGGNLTVGNDDYGLTTAGALNIASMSANWTNAGRTIADLGTVTTADINGGTIDGPAINNCVIGASTAAAGTFSTLTSNGVLTAGATTVSSLSCGDGNITNVGVLEVDTVQSDADAAGLNINFDGNTGTNKLTLTDNLASALDITEGSNSYLKFITTNSGEYISAGKELAGTAGLSVGSSGWLRFGDNSGDSDAQLFVSDDYLILSGASDAGTGATYISGGLDVSNALVVEAGGLTVTAGGITVTAGGLSMNDTNITNVGDINCDTISVDDVTAGLQIQFGGNTATNKITLTDNLAEALTIEESGTDYLKFVTTNGGEYMEAGKELACHGGLSVGDGTTFSFGDNSGDPDAKITMVNSAAQMQISGALSGIAMTGSLQISSTETSQYAVDVPTGTNNANKIRAAAFVTYSDERLKVDVAPMRNALKTVNSLKPVNFTWKKDGAKDFGFLAQDLQGVVPQAVHGSGGDSMYGVDYGRLTSILVSAVQEQSAQIEALKAKLEDK